MRTHFLVVILMVSDRWHFVKSMQVLVYKVVNGKVRQDVGSNVNSLLELIFFRDCSCFCLILMTSTIMIEHCVPPNDTHCIVQKVVHLLSNPLLTSLFLCFSVILPFRFIVFNCACLCTMRIYIYIYIYIYILFIYLLFISPNSRTIKIRH